MYTTHKSTRTIGLVLTTAMAGALLAGCSGKVAPQAAVSATEAQQAMASGKHERAIAHAEAAVLAEPRSAQYRAMLGQAYLDAGRFAAAQTSLDDAMELGDQTPRTALSLALALTAQAKYSEAAALLNGWEQRIAASDLGLALALAGQPERGIHILSNAIRAGENTVKIRQNLAYAYAVAGRWRDARIMVAQDVPADQVGDRMALWGQLVHPAAYQHRVAGLLGVPAGVVDGGQPVQLALANFPSVDQLAAHAVDSPSAPVVAALEAPQPAPVRAAMIDRDRELPALSENDRPPEPAMIAAPAPIQRVAVPASNAGTSAPVDNRYAAVLQVVNPAPALTATPASQPVTAAAVPAWQASQDNAISYVAQPVVQTTQVRHAAAVTPRVSGRVSGGEGTRSVATRAIAPRSAQSAAAADISTPGETAQRPSRSIAALAAPQAGGTHLVQLGSFSSERGARRAWGIYVDRYPQLADREMVITEALVRGKRYFRISAGGFTRAQSQAMCASPRANGGDGCIAWAQSSPLPGAVSTATRLARR